MLANFLLNYTLHCFPGPQLAGAFDYLTVFSAGLESKGMAGIEASLLRALCCLPGALWQGCIKVLLHDRLHLQTTTDYSEHFALSGIISDWLGCA